MWNAVNQQRAVTTGDTREGSSISCCQAAVTSLGWGQQSWGPSTSQQALGRASDELWGVYGDAWGWSSLGMSLLLHLRFLPRFLAWDTSKCSVYVCVWHGSASQDGGQAWRQGPDGRRCAYKQHAGGPVTRVSLSPPAWLPALNPGRDQ